MLQDTIGLAGFGYDFGMISDITSMHPFVSDMCTLLGTTNTYVNLDPISMAMKGKKMRKIMRGCSQRMTTTVKDVVDKRIASGEYNVRLCIALHYSC